MSGLALSFAIERWPLRQPFRISRRTFTKVETLRVTLTGDGAVGHGETVGVEHAGETVAALRDRIERIAAAFLADPTTERLSALLPAGGARNALDAALWDWRAKREGRRVWELLGRTAPGPIPLTATLGIDDPDAMAASARSAPPHTALKLKLGDGDRDMQRLEAVHAASPGSPLLVDVNGGWTVERLKEYAPRLAALGVAMIEQPLPPDEDDALEDWMSPVPLCADESCWDRGDLDRVARRYAMVNIKLEKTGGLTEALALAREAEARGLGVMVGCMLATSLAIAPATMLAGRARWFDLDGPTYLASDRAPGLTFDAGALSPPAAGLWG